MKLFKKLFGFSEQSYSETRKSLCEIAHFTPVPLEGDTTLFRERCDLEVPSRKESISAGIFWMPSVNDLRELVVNASSNLSCKQEASIVQNIVGEARSMHADDSIVRSGDVVQAASQFNALEFPNERTVPEDGIEQYAYDRTQGPACALACFAGTAYRNYLMPVSGTRGQTSRRQCNGLGRVENYLGSETPWVVRNGYIEASNKLDLEHWNRKLGDNPQLREELLSLIAIGIQEDTEVTDVLLKQECHEKKFVTQTYNSAISIGYSRFTKSQWEPLARLVLDATYEATLLLGALKTIQAIQTKQKEKSVIFLTKVGGGVFGNDDDWIREAISRAVANVEELSGIGLDIRVVHFGTIDPRYDALTSSCRLGFKQTNDH